MTAFDRDASASDWPAWQRELRAMAALAWPLALGNLANIAISTTDVIMIGWLGPTQLAASALAASLLFPLHYFCLGVVSAVAAIVAQALGARTFRQVRRGVRQGFWVALAINVPASLILWHGGTILLWSGQAQSTADLADSYLRIALWGLLPMMVFVVLRCLVTGHSRPRAAVLIVLVGVAVNAVSNYGLIFGAWGLPRLELAGAAISSVIVNLVMALGLLVFVLRDRQFRRYYVLARFWRPDWPLFREIFRIGLPIGLINLAEVGMFAVSVMLMGLIGTLQTAAHAIATQCAGITFMVPLGIAQAATIRVGYAAGARDPAGVHRAGWVALLLGVGMSVLLAAGLWFGAEALGVLFLGSGASRQDAVMAMIVSFLGFAALFQIFDSTQAVAAGALRGLKDTRTPMLMATFGYWGIGTGSALVFAFVLDLGGAGLWYGLILGLASVAAMLTARFRFMARAGLR